MSKLSTLVLLLFVACLLVLCHLLAPVWFSRPANAWIAQAAIILVGLLIGRFHFLPSLLLWFRPTNREQGAAERIFGPLCDRVRHTPALYRHLPWVLVTGTSAQVDTLMPGLITERWQVGLRGIFLWCGEPGDIAEADIRWLRRRQGRQVIRAVAWVTDPAAGDTANNEVHQTLWRQLKTLARWLGWRPPVYAVALCDDAHDQFDRPRQSAGVCWAPRSPVDMTEQLTLLASALVPPGMIQIQQERRWSWLLQRAQDLRNGVLKPLAQALQPLIHPQSGILFSGLFLLPVATPGQHSGYRSVALPGGWYELLRQAGMYSGQRDRLIVRDWLLRGVMMLGGIWCVGMLLSAFWNARLVRDNTALLSRHPATGDTRGQYRQQSELQRRIDMLLWRSREHSPPEYRFGLSMNDRELNRLLPVWQQQNQRLMLSPVMQQLTTRLRQYTALPPGSAERRSQSADTYNCLKAYLMLTQPQKAEPAFLVQTLKPLWRVPDPTMSPGEWAVMSADTLRFWSHELPRHQDWQQKSDDVLVADVRSQLRRQKGQSNSERALYQSVLQQAEKRQSAAALTIKDLAGDEADQTLFYTRATLPGIFTREAWEQDVRGIIANVAAARQTTGDWVLDEKNVTEALSEEDLRDHLTRRYFRDYAGAWLDFLNSIRWQHPRTLSDSLEQLHSLGDIQRSPLPSLGKVLRWQAGVGQEGQTMGESLISSAKQLVSGNNKSPVIQRAAQRVMKKNDSKPAAVVMQTFAPLLAIFPAEDDQKSAPAPAGGLTLQDYMLQITQVRLQLQQIITSADPQGGVLSLVQATLSDPNSPLAVTRQRSSLLAASLGENWSGFAATVFTQPLAQFWRGALAPAQRAVNDAWRDQVLNGWHREFVGRYPFADTPADASPSQLAHYIAPQSGVVDQFISSELRGLLEKQGDRWVQVPASEQYMTFNPAFLNAINRLSRTGQEAFAGGEPGLRFELQIRPQRHIEETDLQLDDTALKYFNQQAEWQSFTWPDIKATHPQAVLSYIPLKEDDSEGLPPVKVLAFEGPWALLRLLGEADRKQIDNSRWLISWKTNRGHPVSLLMRTASDDGPLDLLKLRGFTLPETVFSPHTAEGGDEDE